MQMKVKAIGKGIVRFEVSGETFNAYREQLDRVPGYSWLWWQDARDGSYHWDNDSTDLWLEDMVKFIKYFESVGLALVGDHKEIIARYNACIEEKKRREEARIKKLEEEEKKAKEKTQIWWCNKYACQTNSLCWRDCVYTSMGIPCSPQLIEVRR